MISFHKELSVINLVEERIVPTIFCFFSRHLILGLGLQQEASIRQHGRDLAAHRSWSTYTLASVFPVCFPALFNIHRHNRALFLRWDHNSLQPIQNFNSLLVATNRYSRSKLTKTAIQNIRTQSPFIATQQIKTDSQSKGTGGLITAENDRNV